MAASKPVEPQAGTGLPRWQLALLVGTPIVLGVGAVYLWNRSRTKERKGTGERKTPEGSASPVQGQDGAAIASREQDNMVTLPFSVLLPPLFMYYIVPYISMSSLGALRTRFCLNVSLPLKYSQGHLTLLTASDS